jgi:hypothetical protein
MGVPPLAVPLLAPWRAGVRGVGGVDSIRHAWWLLLLGCPVAAPETGAEKRS